MELIGYMIVLELASIAIALYVIADRLKGAEK